MIKLFLKKFVNSFQAFYRKCFKFVQDVSEINFQTFKLIFKYNTVKIKFFAKTCKIIFKPCLDILYLYEICPKLIFKLVQNYYVAKVFV